ncbi:RNA polymerase sigma factor [Sphingobacterium arenae]|uniref:Sigma-70 family RNA polymerase sigma factor n=1 Tax=Sphingobacterium arenae TaxID=1280598 RepID=A0ABR7Y6Q5_9SPHI|nr:sigma-70 family RNA polymerase sigma factor [Sphingobacterium arenae]MBD1426967.1 sigma-70 family RNA polymerase sigma factor [Sphingobacterium arenae]
MADCKSHTTSNLLSRSQTQDEQAFTMLYEAHWEYVFEQAFIRCRQYDIAENITQDIFVALWDQMDELCIENIRGYLYIAVKNRVLNWFEKEKRYVPIAELLVEYRAAAESSDTPLLDKELVAVAEALVNSLNAKQQIIYKMRFEQELDTAEIAKQLKMNRKTVQNQLSLALAQLRASLALLILLTKFF